MLRHLAGVFPFKFMPIEGLPADNSANTDQTAQATPDAAANNTGADTSGAGTQTAQQTTEAPAEKTFTQADVDRILANRVKAGVKAAVKAELQKLTGEGEGAASVDDLKQQLSDFQTKARTLEARETVRDYLSDPENKLNVKPENMRAIEKLIMPDLEYDDTGKPSNLKTAIKAAQSLAPALFTNTPQSVNAGSGRNGAVTGNDMNALIRQQAGYGN